MLYLICYDIVDSLRRDRTSRLLAGYGLRVQKSVFECTLTEEQYDFLQARLATKRYLNPVEDQVRFYPLSSQSRKEVLIVGTQPDYQIDDPWFIA